MHDPHKEDHELHSDEEYAEYEEMPRQGFIERYRGLMGWAIFGLVFIVFALYKLMGLFSTPKATQLEPVSTEKTVLVKNPRVTEPTKNPATMSRETKLVTTSAKTVLPTLTQPTALMGQPQMALPPAVQPAATPAAKSVDKLAPVAPVSTTTTKPKLSVAPIEQRALSVQRPAVTTTTIPANKGMLKPAVPVAATTIGAAHLAKVTTVAPTPVFKPAIVPPATLPAAKPAVTTPATPVVSTTVSAPGALEKKITEVEKNIVQQQKTLETQKSVSQQQLQQIRDELTSMNKDLGAIKAMLKAKPKPRKMYPVATIVKKHPPVLHKKKKMKHHGRVVREEIFIHKYVPTQIYYVEAVVPGRAWLQGSDGETISVSIGSYLEGYGRVTRIDTEKGIVVTSSGHIIPYGIHAQ